MKFLTEENYNEETKERIKILEFLNILENSNVNHKHSAIMYSDEWKKMMGKKYNDLKTYIPEHMEIRDIDMLKAKLLYEGLIRTFSKRDTIKILRNDGYALFTKEKYNLLSKTEKDEMRVDFIFNKKYNTFSFYIDFWRYNIKDGEIRKLIYKEIKHVITLMNNLGWHVSIVTSPNDENLKIKINNFNEGILNKLIIYKTIQMNFQAKYSRELDKIDFPTEAFHLTTNLFIKKILKIGLTPKTKSKLATHPSRIYMAQTLKDIESLKNDLIKNSNNNEKINEIYILKINLEDFNGRLFIDDMASKNMQFEKDCIWTNNNIDNSKITVFKKIRL